MPKYSWQPRTVLTIPGLTGIIRRKAAVGNRTILIATPAKCIIASRNNPNALSGGRPSVEGLCSLRHGLLTLGDKGIMAGGFWRKFTETVKKLMSL